MDGGELKEGITWQELFQVLKDKEKAEDESEVNRYAPCAMRFAFFNKGKVEEDAITWVDLLLLLESERSFFSLRKDSGRKISVEKEKSSKKVLDYFFEKAWERPILKSRPSIV